MTSTTRAAETWAHILAQPDGYPMGIAADYATDDGAEPHEACAAVEAVAQQHLDAHPDDHRARRLLGEWLQWHGDGRGEGMLGLAACERVPLGNAGSGWFSQDSKMQPEDLPSDWLHVLTGWRFKSPRGSWYEYTTRRAAENAAALAFARLPAERRAALLKGEM